jgi:hypothetical protein
MTANSVEEVHVELGYTEADIASLRKVKRIWLKLETAKAKASKGDQHALRSYSELLSKSLVQARQTQPVPDVEVESHKFWNWYSEQCEALDVRRLEIRRGIDHQLWSEKWLPAEHKEFSASLIRTIEMPSYQNFAECRTAASKMLRAYIETLKDT